jgi:hypothetical protein
VILYGLLSEQPACNINPLIFLGRKQTIESFMLPYYMSGLPPATAKEFHIRSEQLCQGIFKTEVNRKFALNEFAEALAFYKEH